MALSDSLKKIVQAKSDRLETVPIAFLSKIERSQKEIFDLLLELIAQLETSGGQVLVTGRNYEIVNQIIEQLSRGIFETEYITAVAEFGSEFNRQATLTTSYFDALFKSKLDPKLIYQQTVNNAIQTALLAFDESAVDTVYVSEVRSILNDAVSRGAEFRETLASLRGVTEDTLERQGKIHHYASTIARDLFSQGDRRHTQVITDELGLEWYLYQGGIVVDSRDFCVIRHGKFFHKKEIDSWGLPTYSGPGTNGKGQWQGRNPSTNPSSIYILLGGFNCLHSLLPVSQNIVPQTDIQRAKSLGFFN